MASAERCFASASALGPSRPSLAAASAELEISVDDLPARVRQFHSQRVVVAADSAEDLVTLEELGQRYLRRVLTLLNGNKTRAAQILGVDRRTLYRMLERLEPSVPAA